MDTEISFAKIYSKAIGLFDDPKITIAYNTNLMQFYKLMYVYLQNSIALFNNPLSVVDLLSEYTEPNGQMEIFESDGVNNIFTLSEDFQIEDNSIYQYIAHGEKVTAVLDKENRTVTFSEVLPEGQEYSIEQYSIGKFKCDFTTIGGTDSIKRNIIQYSQDILARLLVKSWGESTRNFLLDIQNILTDSDFKLHSSSNALRPKNDWIDQLDTEILQYQNKLAWNIRMAKIKS